jgi:type I restriction enzyme S subunit
LYYLLAAKKDEYLVPLMQGTANVSLKERDIGNVEISVPSLAEQHRIVARIEALAGRVDEAERLREQAAEQFNRLLIAMAHRTDLDETAKRERGWHLVRFGEILEQTEDPHAVQAGQAYPNLGIYSFGRGLFVKPSIDGVSTSAKSPFFV